jgi:hypothetical protein
LSISDATAPPGTTSVGFVARAVLLFAAAFAIVLVVVVGWNGGPRLFATRPTLEVAGNTLIATRGRGHAEATRYRVDATDASGIAMVTVAGTAFEAVDYPRITWRLPREVPPGLQLNIAWRRRDAPGRLYSEPIEWSRGPAYIDLNGHPDWTGRIDEVSLAIRGRLTAPLSIAGVGLRTGAWSITFVDTLDDWRRRALLFEPGSFTLMAGERQAIAPLAPVVAGTVAVAIGWLVWRARRRGLRFPLPAALAVFLIGWLALDLRTQAHFAAQHAANFALYAGKAPDAKVAAGSDGTLFEAARKLRDATRERPARVLVLSENAHLATRIGWFLYPDNVWYDARPGSRRAVPSPEQLRPGDQVVLVVYEAIAWDAARNLLVWRDGRTRPARALLADDPALTLVRVE